MENFREETLVCPGAVETPVITVDTAGMVREVNAAFESVWGWAAGSSAGLPVSRMVPARLRTAFEIAWSRYRAARKWPLDGQVLRLPILDREGRERLADVCLRPRGPASPGCGWESGVEATVCPAPDGRERLPHPPRPHGLDDWSAFDPAAIIARMDRTLDALPDAAVWVGCDGLITWCSAAFSRLCGLTGLHVVGESIFRLLPLEREGRAVSPEEHPAGRMFCSAIPEVGWPTLYQFRGSGGCRTLQIRGSRFDMAGIPAAGFLILRDVTEQKLADSWIDRDVRIMRLLGAVAAECNQSESGEAVLRSVLEPVCREFGFAAGRVVFFPLDGLGPAAPEHWFYPDPVQHGAFCRDLKVGHSPAAASRVQTVAETLLPSLAAETTPEPESGALRSVFAFPVPAGHRPAAVVELFGTDAPDDPDGLLNFAVQLGAQVGRAFERGASEMRLLLAARQLEDRVEQRTSELARLNEALTREVGERKLAQLAASAATLRCHTLFRSISDVVFSLSGSWRLVLVNPAFTTLTGFKSEAWIGRKALRLVHPEDRRYVAAQILRITRGAETTPFECRILTAGGEFLSVECNVSLLREEDGSAALIGVLRDITARRTAERELHLLHRAVAATSEGICILDPSRSGSPILYANSGFERLTGYPAAGIVGTPFEAVYGQDARPAGVQEILAAMAQGRPCTAEIPACRVNGARYWARLAVTPVLTDLGEMTHYVAVISDITRQKEAEKRENDLISLVSHELRTPLTGMRGLVELLLENEFDSAKRRRFLETILREAERLASLVNDFLDVERLQSGKENFHFNPVQFDLLVRETLVLFEEAYPSHRFVVDCPETPPAVPADGERIRRALSNLLSNAVKFSPAGGLVRVSIERQAERVVVGVHDQGIGIPEEALPKLFVKFFRVDSPESRKAGGTGLGLSIVKEIVQAHGGSVWVYSVKNRGSSFYFSIPVARAVSPPPSSPADSPAPRP